MQYVYDRVFKHGFILGILVFIILNIGSYIVALQRHEDYLQTSSMVAPATRFRWGFPFVWDGYNFGFVEDGALNIVVAAAFGFAGGFVMKTVFVNFANKPK